MLITFKSKAAADILMYEEHAKRILDLLGKDAKRGIVTAAETQEAIEKLEAEIAADRAHHSAQEIEHDVRIHHNETGDDNEHEQAQAVSFSTRAYPLLEMLRAAHQEGRDVVWGV